MEEIDAYNEIEIILKVWDRNANRLNTLLIVLGTVAITTSLIVTTFSNESWFLPWIKVPSIISTLCLTIIASFSLGSKGNNNRNAWRHVQKVKMLYLSKKANIEELIKAYTEGEKMVGNIDFTFQTLKHSKDDP